MRLLPLFSVLCISLCFVCPVQGAIEMEAIGQPIDGNSWSQVWRFHHAVGEPQIDLISFRMDSPNGRFKGAVAVSEFSENTWREAYKSDWLAYAVGHYEWPELKMKLSFEDDRKDMQCTVFLFERGKQDACQEIFLDYCMKTNHWQVTCWDHVCHPCPRPDYLPPSVPEPTMLAIWSAFGALGLMAARRRGKVA